MDLVLTLPRGDVVEENDFEEVEEKIDMEFDNSINFFTEDSRHSISNVLKHQAREKEGKTVDERVRDLKRKSDVAFQNSDEKMQQQPVKKRKIHAEVVPVSKKHWDDLRLSKPIRKALNDLEFERPTPVQFAVIPLALGGTDILGNAQTGSGKTAAFMLPCLERLFLRPKSDLRTRVLVLCPTRELAAQGFEMTEKMGKYLDLRTVLVVGGLSLKVQEASLRNKPDIIVATPGRLLDHLRNSMSVHLDFLEILILDEADKLLELGFKEEIMQILHHLPSDRQTMLFSATLSDEVEELATLSLLRPKRISVDPFMGLAKNLSQEFVRIRGPSEKYREAMVLSLCKRSFHDRVMIFCPTKIKAHRLKIIFSLLDLKSAEIHGNLTQRQRLESLQQFKEGEVNYLICTNLVARGIDVPCVETVINMYFPRDLKTYIHRVGRTARAGRTGCSVTLVGEDKRTFLKELMKEAKTRGETIKSRLIDPKHVQENFECIRNVHIDIKNIVSEEMEEKEIRIAEMEANRAENLIVHEDEIRLKPKRTWFMSERDKKDLKEKTLNKLLKKETPAAKPKQTKSKTEKRNHKAQQEIDLREKEMWATKRMAKGALSQQKKKKETDDISRGKKKRKTRRYERHDGRSSSHRIDKQGEKLSERFEGIGKKVHKAKKKKKSRHIKSRR